MKPSSEPSVWFLFGAGGMLAAVFGPVLVLITGVFGPFGRLIPAEALDYPHTLAFTQTLIGKGVVLAVISLFLFHGVHRLYHTLHDLGYHTTPAIRGLFYGGAAAGTGAAAVLLLAIWF
jgi:fumarate reductase subunit D